MKVTPLELRQRQFTTVMRGYDRVEVNTFLAQAADDFEALMLENDRLRQEAGKAEAALNEHRGQEKQLSNTLLTAQKIADDIREKAQHDAARFISEAEGRIAMIVDKSQVRVGEVQREIEVLRAKRREVEISLENLVATLNKTIESVRDRDVQHEERTSLLLPTRDAAGRDKPSVVLPLKEPSAPLPGPDTASLSSSTTSSLSSSNVVPAAPQPSTTPAVLPPASPSPSVVVASTPSAPVSAPAVPSTPAPSVPSSPTPATPSAAAPQAPAPASTSSSTALAAPSVVKPTPATPASTSPAASPARPSAEAQGARP